MPEPCAKVPYASADEAHRALVRVRAKRSIKRRAEAKSYKCRHCGAYHLTSHPK